MKNTVYNIIFEKGNIRDKKNKILEVCLSIKNV